MAEFVAAALSAVCDDVVASGGGAAGLEVIPDPDELRHHGPIVGIVAVLQRFDTPVLAVGVDQPWVRVASLAELAARCDDRPVVPVDGGARQVTCAVYTPSFLSAAAAAQAAGSIQSALDHAAHDLVEDWSRWGEDGRSWFSVDADEDIEAGLRRFGRPQLPAG